jgi:hypothetical protein
VLNLLVSGGISGWSKLARRTVAAVDPGGEAENAIEGGAGLGRVPWFCTARGNNSAAWTRRHALPAPPAQSGVDAVQLGARDPFGSLRVPRLPQSLRDLLSR